MTSKSATSQNTTGSEPTGSEPIGSEPTDEDARVPEFWRALGLPGLADVHVHFMPPRLLNRIWAYFDAAGPLVGTEWAIRYRWPQTDRVEHLRRMGVRVFSALAYVHRSGMAAELNAWTLDFARTTPGCLPSATFYPEPGVTGYVTVALDAGARVFKVHTQVGGFPVIADRRVQARRTEAEGAGSDREPAGGLSVVPPRRGVPEPALTARASGSSTLPSVGNRLRVVGRAE